MILSCSFCLVVLFEIVEGSTQLFRHILIFHYKKCKNSVQARMPLTMLMEKTC